MVFRLITFLGKIAVGGLVILSMVCLAAVFVSRLPDQEVCVTLDTYSSSQPPSTHVLIFDITTGRSALETRNETSAATIGSPDGTNWIFLKPVETERYDVYLRYTNTQSRPFLLQHGVW